jgi:hypothetical protein
MLKHSTLEIRYLEKEEPGNKTYKGERLSSKVPSLSDIYESESKQSQNTPLNK